LSSGKIVGEELLKVEDKPKIKFSSLAKKSEPQTAVKAAPVASAVSAIQQSVQKSPIKPRISHSDSVYINNKLVFSSTDGQAIQTFLFGLIVGSALKK
jgi:hypothetical protein